MVVMWAVRTTKGRGVQTAKLREIYGF